MSAAPPTDHAAGECTTGSVVLQRNRLDIYIVLDDSASMSPYWQDVLVAFDAFVADKDSVDIGVGLTLVGNACDPGSHAQPRVPIAPLPENAPALRAAIPTLPADGAATLPALRGSIQHAQSWSEEHPDSDIIVLMLTAAVPTECNISLEEVAQLAHTSSELQPPVTTEIVVLGVIGANLVGQLSSAEQFQAVTQTSALDILDALREIRAHTRACHFALPDNLQDTTPNLRLNIAHEHPDAALGTIPPLADSNACGDTNPGWYYADPNAITLCPQSCKALGSDPIKALTERCDHSSG